MRLSTLALVAGLWVGGCDNGDGKDADSSTNPGTDIDADGDGYNADEDCDDEDDSINPNAVEACDGIDNDCDSDIDEAGATGGGEFFADADGDGYGDAGTSTTACTAPPDYIADSADCDDGDGAVNPGATEVCDGADNDCDNLTDDDDSDADLSTFYPDVDGDGYGEEGGTPVEACEMPADYAAEPVDCDDSSAEVYPGGTEVCDGLDNDCDGTSDDGFSTTSYYLDVDGDGFGDDATATTACEPLAGYVDIGGDCDDTVAASFPGASETCDGVDNDCNGSVDDGVSFSNYYVDTDGDGYGDDATLTLACVAPAGSVALGGDCDETAAGINPGAAEICDARDVDEDCNGVADDDDAGTTDATTYYIDTDGDGSGDDSTSVMTCDAPPAGYVDNANDPFEDASFGPFANSGDIQETTDVVVGSAAIYAVGFNSDDEVTVVSIDPSTGAVSEVYTGDPLVQPSGITLSEDESMLYVADVAAETSGGNTSGGVYEIPVSGGAAGEIGVAGTIDMPGDVALSMTSGMLLVTGFSASGMAAIYEVDAMTGGATMVVSGSPLADPLAITADPTTGAVYVLDSEGADGQSAILAFDPSWSLTDELAVGFDFAFPGGIALGTTGSLLFYGTSTSVVAVNTDGSGTSETLATTGLLMPGGMDADGGSLYVTELSSEAAADLYLLSY